MKKLCLIAVALFALAVTCHGQSPTAVTYQGRLALGGVPANGHYDFKFSLHAAGSGGGPVANTIAKPPILVTDGLFATTLDFGAAGFPGDKRWLEIAVRPTGSTGNYQTLAPRQRITAAPYALEAATVADAAVTAQKLSPGAGPDGQVLKMSGGQLAWGTTGTGGGVSSVASGLGLTGGPITSTGTLAIDTAVVPRLTVANAFSNPGNSFVGSFAGNGAGLTNLSGVNYNGANLTNLNASNISSGTLNDARLSANAALRNAHQTFTGSNTFSGAASFTSSTNRFVGAFIGNGAGLTNLSGIVTTNYNGASITNLNASNISSGTLNDARLSANVALRNATQAFTGANTFGNAGNSFVGSFTGNGAGLTNLTAVASTNYNGASLTNLNASNISSGTLNDARLSANAALRNANQTFTGSNIFTGVASLTNVANRFAGTFSGNGAGLTNLTVVASTNYNGANLTNLNASNISSGTLNDARLSANVALRNATQAFAGANTFGNAGNSFVGSFTGNGAGLTNLSGVASTNYDGTSLTNLNASNISSGTLNDARLSANVALRSAPQTFTGSNTFAGVVSLTNVANRFVGTFSGDGAGLANVNAAFTNALVGDVTGLPSATTVARIRGVNVSVTGPVANQLLRYNGSTWTPGAVALGSDVSGTLGVANGGTGGATAPAARASLGAAASGVNSDITSLTGLTIPLSASQGGSGLASYTSGDLLFANSASSLARLASVSPGNTLISGGIGVAPLWGKVGLTTHVSGTLPLANGGSGAATAAAARNNFGAAASGANSDITSLAGLTTPLSASQGGSGLSSYASGDLLFANSASSLARLAGVSPGNVLVSGGIGVAPLWGKVGLTTHVSGTLPLANGGSGAATAAAARSNFGAAASGANSDITSLTGLSAPISASQGGSGLSSYTSGDLLFANSASSLARLASVSPGNALITGGIGVAPFWGKIGLTTHVSGTLSLANGGTGATTAPTARGNLGAAASGANSDITSLASLTTPLSPSQGGSGQSAYSTGDLLFASAANALARRAIGGAGQVLASQGGVPVWTNPNAHDHFGQIWSGTTVDGLYVQNTSSEEEGASGVVGIVTGLTNVNYGLFGQTESSQGTGVQGLALAASGLTTGVSGESGSTDGIGVYGVASAISGTNAGVLGESSSPSGLGVSGQALATTGIPVGVYGYSAAATGYGFYTPSRLYVGNNAFVGGHLTIGVGSRIQADAGTTNSPGVTFFGNTGAGMFSPGTNVLGFATSGNQRLHVAADGKIGVGRVAATNRFEVEGEASKTTAGGWLANSDAAIKTEIHSVTGALDKLNQVRPVAFRYTPEYLRQHPDIEDKVYYNVIAQEFAQVFPDSVKASGESLNGRDILQVDTYPAIICSLAAIQELRGEVRTRDRELTELRIQNQKLEARLKAIEQHLAAKAR